MSGGTKTLAFGYDAAGNRVRKESMSGGTTTKQWYVRDAQGNIMSTYKQVGTGTLKQEYVYLYGSTRTGEYLLNRDSATLWNRHYYRVKGNRHYELTNHLGNVLAVVTDRKIAKDTTADLIYTPQFFMPDVYSVQNYYAFGQSMPKWSTTAAVNDPKKYRFGYNGKEDDDEWGKQCLPRFFIGDYGFRISDPRIGRFLSVDPLMKDYPAWSPYPFAMNRPIDGVDLDGLEWDQCTDENGNIEVSVNVNFRIDEAVTSLGLSDEKIKEYKDAVSKQLDLTLRESLGSQYSGYVTFEEAESNEVIIPILTFESRKKVTDTKKSFEPASTTYSAIGASLTDRNGDLYPLWRFAENVVHELFHTVRLDHPTETTQVEDTRLVRNGSDMETTQSTDTKISYNIMNYRNITKINGFVVTTDPMPYITKGQFNFIMNEIKLQKAGAGRKNIRDYYQIYLWPGEPVREK